MTARVFSVAALILFSCTAAAAQNWPDTGKINSWFEKNKNRTYEIQKPGPIQKSGTIRPAGNIQVPKGLAAIKSVKEDCKERLVVNSDTLFEFDKSTLTPYAEEALKLLAPKISKLDNHPIVIEGHTDSVGDDNYNKGLSERRAERVRNWLLENHVVGGSLSIAGYGEKQPVAPNTNKDGTDNPAGRALNRRVEVVIDTCKTLDQATQPAVPGGGVPESAPPQQSSTPAALPDPSPADSAQTAPTEKQQ